MKNNLQKILFFVLALFVFSPTMVSAHQPRLLNSDVVKVNHSETSQAFYGELKGRPNVFQIEEEKDFRLYVGLLVPDISGIKKDLAVRIDRTNKTGNETIAIIDGQNFDWTPFYEEYAKDNYFWGPEFKARDSQKGVALKGRVVPAGKYSVIVSSPSNQGKYSLAIGDAEVFPANEIVNAIITVPQVKAKFFHHSPLQILFSKIGLGDILFLFFLAFVFGFVYRALLRKFANTEPYKRHKNIGKNDRLIRASLGIVLIIWAIMTNWNPFLIFFSGFCFFEAIFSWCGFYAAIGKNSCPL